MSITIALAGNPNCGKTTMFNDLTGSNQYVGNWPGIRMSSSRICPAFIPSAPILWRKWSLADFW